MSINISPPASRDQKRERGETPEASEGIVGLLDGHTHGKEMPSCQSPILKGPKGKPKLQSAQAVLSPRADGKGEENPEISHTLPPCTPGDTAETTTHKLPRTGDITQPPQAHLPETYTRAATHTQPTNTSTHSTSHAGTLRPGVEEERDGRVEEKEEGEQHGEEGMQWDKKREMPRRSLWRLRDRGMEDRWGKVRREWRRSASSLERTSAEQGMAWEREARTLAQDDRTARDRCREEGEEEGERARERRSVGEGERRAKDMVPHHILSRMLVHSASSSSSSSSFNCSSPESDEVFSEGEDVAARRKIMKRVSGHLCG